MDEMVDGTELADKHRKIIDQQMQEIGEVVVAQEDAQEQLLDG